MIIINKFDSKMIQIFIGLNFENSLIKKFLEESNNNKSKKQKIKNV